MDSSQPLLWDLAWLIVFGLGPLGIVWVMTSSGRGGGGGQLVAPGLIIVTISAGLVSGVGPSLSGRQETIVVFRQQQSQQAMMETILSSGATVRWTDASGLVWGISETSLAGTLRLYGSGAALVSTTPIIAGCLAWTRA